MKKLVYLVLIISLIPFKLFAQRAQDSLALVALHNSTNGLFWNNRTNWLSSKPISTWYGITLTNGRVTSINFYNNNLFGNIPPEIGNLTNLSILSLTHNLISSIPKEIGNLTNLTRLFIDENQLSGPIPKEIGNLTKLTYLTLSKNQLSGSNSFRSW
jgi:Leucine-rich repeat (LRR) protein